MPSPFDIQVVSWDRVAEPDPLLEWTSASLCITADDKNLTKNISTESKSSHETACLAVYPLALWFARSWWRLCYETGQLWSARNHDPYWRLAHEMQSAGEGFVWPDITFVSDSKSVQILTRKTEYPDNVSGFNYLTEHVTAIPIQQFTGVMTKCILDVFDRLQSAGLDTQKTALFSHWEAVNEEMQEPDARFYRKIEAMFGYDPDGADEDFMNEFIEKGRAYGTGVIEELASITKPDDRIFDKISELVANPRSGIEAHFQPLSVPVRKIVSANSRPWKIGRDMAIEVRNACGRSEGLFKDGQLCELLGISKDSFCNDTGETPFTVGLISRDDSRAQLYFKGKSRLSRRFQASRVLADKLIANNDNQLLPVTKSATVRQKIQRAFAGELLCPSDELLAFLDGTYDNDTIAEAADYFDVQESVPRTHLVNREILSPEALAYADS